MTETELMDYNDSITDFSMSVTNYGPMNIAFDFNKYYPTQFRMFLKAAKEVSTGQQVAALFKPKQ